MYGDCSEKAERADEGYRGRGAFIRQSAAPHPGA